MKHCVLLSLLLVLGCTHLHGAPVEHGQLQQGSCEDPSALGAASLAVTKINQDRKEGYIFSLHRLSNVHTAQHVSHSTGHQEGADKYTTNLIIKEQRRLQFVQLFKQEIESKVKVKCCSLILMVLTLVFC